MDPTKQRGYLNNNPGNINRVAGKPWMGEIATPTDPRLTDFQRNELTNGRFAVFATPHYGIRAIVKNLQAYQEHLGLTSIRGMIYRWAPAADGNDTERYVREVAAELKVDPLDAVSMQDYKTAKAMACAIIRVENGGMPYSNADIESGLTLANMVKPVGFMTSNTIKGSISTAAGMAADQATTVLQSQINDIATLAAPAASQSSTAATLVVILKVASVLLTVGGIALIVYERYKRARQDQKVTTTAPLPEPVPAGQSNPPPDPSQNTVSGVAETFG